MQLALLCKANPDRLVALRKIKYKSSKLLLLLAVKDERGRRPQSCSACGQTELHCRTVSDAPHTRRDQGNLQKDWSKNYTDQRLTSRAISKKYCIVLIYFIERTKGILGPNGGGGNAVLVNYYFNSSPWSSVPWTLQVKSHLVQF